MNRVAPGTISTKWILGALILLALAVRLVKIEQPFVDAWSWRQSDVAAIARNYFTSGFNFALPQIDWAGETAGYVGTEFPILPFLAALLYRSAGVHEWIGRSFSLLFFAASLPIFFLLVRRLFDETIALWALTFYCFAPLSIMASRVFMPDLPSLVFGLAGVYFYLRWLEEENALAFFGASFCLALALLLKAPTALLGAPLFYLTWQRFRWRMFLRIEVWVFAAVALIPSAIWYTHAQQVARRYYPHHFFGEGGFRIMGARWYARIVWEIFTSSLTPVLALLALGGLLVRPKEKYQLVFHWWLAVMGLFLLIAGWGNRHQWYQLPLVPIAAVFAARACASFFREPKAVAVVVLFGAWSFASARPFYRATSGDLQRLGLELKKISAPNALIIAADNGDPTAFYYAERKGWHFLEDGVYLGAPRDDAQAIADFDKLRRRGASYFVFFSGTRWWLKYYPAFAAHLESATTLLEDEPEFVIYRLRPEARPTHP